MPFRCFFLFSDLFLGYGLWYDEKCIGLFKAGKHLRGKITSVVLENEGTESGDFEMEKEVIFHVLGISETKDEKQIRSAYYEQLHHTNPEDDPQGFQRLRKAYEEALSYARKVNETDEKKEKPMTQIECWMQKVEELYQDIRVRANCEKWQKLLEDDVCQALDTALEAREKFLVYLMDHVQLPHSVWKQIEKAFDILEEREELEQIFPKNFLDYVCYYIENETFLPFELLDYRGLEEDGSSADAYLEAYFGIKRKLDAGETEEIEQNFSDLEAYGVYHPFEEIERLRYLNMLEKKEQAYSLAQSIMKKEWYKRTDVELMYAWLYVGETLYHAGKIKEADELWQKVLKEEPRYYRAKFDHCQYLLKTEQYYDAKEKLLELMDMDDQNEEAIQMIHKANEYLIRVFQKEIAEGKEDEHFPGQELTLELGWNLFQNDRFDEAEELIMDMVPDEEHLYDYNNLLGCLLYQMEQYERAIPYLENWLKLNKALVEDGTSKTKKRISRRGRACQTLGSCYYKAGRTEEGYALMEEAIANYKDMGEKLNGMQFLADQLLKVKKYEKAIAISEQIIAEEETYYPAYLIQQEAYYHLERDQEVIDNYYRAIEIYPGYYKPYLYAIMSFFRYSQYEDANGVLERAKENKVEFSPWMKLYEVKILRNLKMSEKEYRKIAQLLDELDTIVEQGKECDIEDKSEISFERAILYWNSEKYAQAIEMIQKALLKNPERMQYHVVKGHIYQEMKKYEAALQEYEMVEKKCRDIPDILYAKGRCYERLEQQEVAIDCYQKCLKCDEFYRDVNEKISDYYAERYQQHYHKKDLEKALYHATKQLEAEKNCYYYVNRGLIYMDAYMLHEAIADFEKALEYMPQDWAAWNNLGCCYKYLGEFDKAIECLNKAAAYMQTAKKLPYGNMADCYEAQNDFANARKCYKKNLELFPDELEYWEEIGDTYYNEENMQKAREAYGKAGNKANYDTNIGDVWRQEGKKHKAEFFYKRRVKTADTEEEKSTAYEKLGNFYAEEQEYRKAILAYKQANSYKEKKKDKFRIYVAMVRTYLLMEHKKDAAKYAALAKEAFEESAQGKEEEYLAFKPYAPYRYGIFGWIYLGLGQAEKAEEMFQKMGQMLRCRSCQFHSCYEGELYLGYLYEFRAEYEKACRFYQKVLEIVPNDIETRNQIKSIEKKNKKQKKKKK